MKLSNISTQISRIAKTTCIDVLRKETDQSKLSVAHRGTFFFNQCIRKHRRKETERNDTVGYVDRVTGYATSKNIKGPYIFHGPLLFNGKPIYKWDMGGLPGYYGEGRFGLASFGLSDLIKN
jgi:hypothetical protein